MKAILFRITNITRDRRSKAQLETVRATEQGRLDLALERLWRQRVDAKVQARKDRRIREALQAATQAQTPNRQVIDFTAARRAGSTFG